MEEFGVIFIVVAEKKKKENRKRMALQGQLVIEYPKLPSGYAEIEEDALKVIDGIAKTIGGTSEILGITKSQGEMQ